MEEGVRQNSNHVYPLVGHSVLLLSYGFLFVVFCVEFIFEREETLNLVTWFKWSYAISVRMVHFDVACSPSFCVSLSRAGCNASVIRVDMRGIE